MKAKILVNNKPIPDQVKNPNDFVAHANINIDFGRTDPYTITTLDTATFSVENNNNNIKIGDDIKIQAIANTGKTVQYLPLYENEYDHTLIQWQTLPLPEEINNYVTVSEDDEVNFILQFTQSEHVDIYATVGVISFDGHTQLFDRKLIKSNTQYTQKIPAIETTNALPFIKISVDETKTKYENINHIYDEMNTTYDGIKNYEIYLNFSNAWVEKTSQNTAVNVFHGFVDSIQTNPNSNNLQTAQNTINCISIYAKTQGHMIGDKPFPTQTVQERLEKINQLTNHQYKILLPGTIPPLNLITKDIDNQSVAEQLEDIAKATDTIIRTLENNTIYFEDPNNRPTAKKLKYNPNTNQHEITPTNNGITINAENILYGLNTEQSNNNTAGTVKVSWKEEQPPPQPGERPTITEHYETQTDQEKQNLYGYKTISISTELADKTQAQKLARKIMNRQNNLPNYNNLLITQDSIEDPLTFLTLIGTNTRAGKLLTLTNLPTPINQNQTQINGYVEGGTITYTGWKWQLQATLNTNSYGASSITYDEILHTYNTFQNITYKDLQGAKGENEIELINAISL